MIWTPTYTITPTIARSLMTIEAAKAVVERTPLPPPVEAELRKRARIRATHYSTRIEGNRLTLAETERVVEGGEFFGRERDVREVKNYWDALVKIEEWTAKETPLSEELIKRLHALVENGKRAKPSPYREAQNVIKDSISGAIVYLPPEAKDVPVLMDEMIAWVKKAEKEGLPVPLISALLHYQFVTIHPYFDGNGRTARLLATFILHRGGYGLNGFFSLEEYHARELDEYYRAIAVHPHHNYYEGREEADLTPWLEYFTRLMAAVFSNAKDEALRCAGMGLPAEPTELKKLDRRARTVIALFHRQDSIVTADVAKALGVAERTARGLLKEWVADGWLQIADLSKKARRYILSAKYRQFIGEITAE